MLPEFETVVACNADENRLLAKVKVERAALREFGFSMHCFLAELHAIWAARSCQQSASDEASQTKYQFEEIFPFKIIFSSIRKPFQNLDQNRTSFRLKLQTKFRNVV